METHIKRFDTAGDFLEEVGERLYAHASVNNLMLGICERLVAEPTAYTDPFFAVVSDSQGVPLLAVVMTPPHNLILAEGEDFEVGLPALIEYLKANGIAPPGVIGPVDAAEAFFNRWTVAAGLGGEVAMYQRVYELRQVYLPKLPPGHFRIAHAEDCSRIAGWIHDFNLEALAKDQPVKEEWAEGLIEKGKVFIWEDGGQPVAMAMKSRPLKDSSTVSGVYTPPEHRRKGYATALVARLSQHLLDMGYSFINLFTDLENPTSNSIYQKIGYRPVTDFRSYTFTSED
jgi:predicted GNAT family acetyltransferase